MSGWGLLALAIVIEVAGSTALKLSEGFSRPLPTAFVLVAFGLTFYLLSLIVRRLPLGVTYAVWSGVGTALTAIVSVVLFGEALGGLQLLGLALIIGGVIVLNATTRTAPG